MAMAEPWLRAQVPPSPAVPTRLHSGSSPYLPRRMYASSHDQRISPSYILRSTTNGGCQGEIKSPPDFNRLAAGGDRVSPRIQ